MIDLKSVTKLCDALYNSNAQETQRIYQLLSDTTKCETADVQTLIQATAVSALLASTPAGHNDKAMPALIYQHFVDRVDEDDRVRTCVKVSLAVENGFGWSALSNFVFLEPSIRIISTATIGAAVYMPLKDNDSLTGPRFLLKSAQVPGLPQHTVVGILHGLLTLGDLQLLPMLRGSWDLLSDRGTQILSQCGSMMVSALHVEYMMEWLESLDDESRLGSVAGALARDGHAAQQKNVTDFERKLPANTPEHIAKPLLVRRTWTAQDYGAKIIPRLERLAESEEEPKVLPKVIEMWS